MVTLLKIILALFGVLFVAGMARTWQMQHNDNAELFRKGTVPSPLPDGLYYGSVPGHTVSWQGKKFNAVESIGINVFNDGERYPFTTVVGMGLRDGNTNVLKIDYDISGNSFWLRRILDEIVQTAPDTYLGKLHVRVIPSLSFTLGYFVLTK